MEATKLKVGGWVRNLYNGEAFRVEGTKDEGGDVPLAGLLDGRPFLVTGGHSDLPGWEPWTPRVGEWCRHADGGPPFRVSATYAASAGCLAYATGEEVGGVLRSVILGELVPCLAPLPENAGLRPAPVLRSWNGDSVASEAEPEKGNAYRRMRITVAHTEPVPQADGFHIGSAPVEPRGFAVGDFVRLNAKGREAWGPYMDQAWARQARDGCTVTGREGDMLVYGAGWGVHFDHVEHVPSAPVYSPPPPSGAVAEIGAQEIRWVAKHKHAESPASGPEKAGIHARGSVVCPICRGPAVEMVTSIACLAAECVEWREPVKPEPVVEWWLRYPRGHIGTVPKGTPGAEPVYVVGGHRHPNEAEAIRLYRAKVEQGGRR